jgi:hypothetical protein
VSTSVNKLSAEEHAKLDRLMLIAADEARGHHKQDGSGKHTFGAKGAHVVYPDGQYHDFSSSGPTRHGRGGFEQGKHLHPNVDPVEWSRAFLAAHPGMGNFVPTTDTNTEGSAEEDVARLAYINALLEGAATLTDNTPGYRFFTEARRLSLPPEVLALLRWIPNFRGDEGAVLVPYTDHAGKLLALGFTYITQAGQKSPHSPARMIYRGPRDWNSHALVRLGKPGPVAVEVEGFEKGLAAFLVGYQCVFITGGVERFGKVPLLPEVQKVILGRDDDPPGSDADQALWRAAMRRRAQHLQVGVTVRPKTLEKKGAPPWPEAFKDLDDVYRHNPELLSILLDNADLDPKKHGRLGEAVDNAILDEVSWFDEVEFGRAGKDAAGILGVGSVERLSARIAKLVKARIKVADGEEGPDGLPGKPITFPKLVLHPDPVDGAELLFDIRKTLPEYIRMSPAACDAAALGVLHGHCFDCFDIMMLFVITSPHMRSGKTKLSRIIARMVPKKLFISGGSAAFIIRAIEKCMPNLFADEFDTTMKKDPEKAEATRGAINACFDREGAFMGLCVPTENGQDPRIFSVWCPIWLSGIKKVWDTVEDRAAHIHLQRKLPGDKVKPLRSKGSPEFDIIRSKAARWAADNAQALRDAADPPCPEALAEYSDRAVDAWGVLFTIAQVADKSGAWLKRAHTASLVLNSLQDETGAATEAVVDKDEEIALLVDVFTIVLAIDAHAPEVKALREPGIAVTAMEAAKTLADADQKPAKLPKVTPVSSGVQLAAVLAQSRWFPDRRWSELEQGSRPIKSNYLVKFFRNYKIEQKTVRVPGEAKTLYGFPRTALDDVVAAYGAPPGGVFGGYNLLTHSHILENVKETGSHTNSNKSAKTASSHAENPSDSAAHSDAQDAQDAGDAEFGRAVHTDANSPSEAPKSPQSNIVDLPIGAVPRRKKESEP